ncbi:MAG TPA: hypothetical protein VG944_13050, partial [Fimbriimonas sp.]|nr:hypothetical protein [Fimbriimonas sp.]
MIGPVALLSLFALLCSQGPHQTSRVSLPFAPRTWEPDGDHVFWWSEPAIQGGLAMNFDYIHPPKPGADRGKWLAALHQLRKQLENPSPPRFLRFETGGDDAWARVDQDLSKKLDLKPGEKVQVGYRIRTVQGVPPKVAIAFDYVSRQSGAWMDWSKPVSAKALSGGMEEVEVPRFDTSKYFVRLIVGEASPPRTAPSESDRVWELSDLSLSVPNRNIATDSAPQAISQDRSLYQRADLAWGAANFANYFLFMYDEEFFDRKSGKYMIDSLLDRLDRDFGGVDSLVLWQAYPRIGLDERNQFDFYRDMPG